MRLDGFEVNQQKGLFTFYRQTQNPYKPKIIANRSRSQNDSPSQLKSLNSLPRSPQVQREVPTNRIYISIDADYGRKNSIIRGVQVRRHHTHSSVENETSLLRKKQQQKPVNSVFSTYPLLLSQAAIRKLLQLKRGYLMRICRKDRQKTQLNIVNNQKKKDEAIVQPKINKLPQINPAMLDQSINAQQTNQNCTVLKLNSVEETQLQDIKQKGKLLLFNNKKRNLKGQRMLKNRMKTSQL